MYLGFHSQLLRPLRNSAASTLFRSKAGNPMSPTSSDRSSRLAPRARVAQPSHRESTSVEGRFDRGAITDMRRFSEAKSDEGSESKDKSGSSKELVLTALRCTTAFLYVIAMICDRLFR
jgi:hypothetical protein